MSTSIHPISRRVWRHEDLMLGRRLPNCCSAWLGLQRGARTWSRQTLQTDVGETLSKAKVVKSGKLACAVEAPDRPKS